MKQWKEEKRVLKKECIHSIVLFSLLILSSTHAQIPINGFCRFRSYEVKSGLTNLFAVDYNNDGFRDLVISGPANNNYQVLTSDSRSNYSKIGERTSSINLSNVHPISTTFIDKKFLALSRKSRELAVASFSSGGNINMNSKIRLEGFGHSIDAGKLDDSGNMGVIASGTSLAGIHVFKENRKRLIENDLIRGKIFSDAVFIDLNYDSYSDIAAVDILSNSIVLFYNNQIGDFEESRSIGIHGEIKELRAVDFNNDKFTDIAFIKNGKLEVLLGDSVSTFQNQVVLNLPSTIKKYFIFDYNGDGFNDVAVINAEKNSVDISFGKSDNSFQPPLSYYIDSGLNSITAFVDRGGRKLAALSSSGKLVVINTITFADDYFSIACGGTVNAVQSFDLYNDGFKDFCYFDNSSMNLRLMLSERRNLFRTLISVPLNISASDIVVDDLNKNYKTFFCFNKGNRIIETVRYDFDNNKITKATLYTKNVIDEVKLVSDRLKDRQTILALERMGDKRIVEIFELRNMRQSYSYDVEIGKNINASSLTFNIYRDVYTVSQSQNSVQVIRTILDRKIIEQGARLSFEIKPNTEFTAKTFCIDDLFLKSKPGGAILSIGNNAVLYLFVNENNYRFTIPVSLLPYGDILNKIENDRMLSVFVNDGKSKKLYRLKIKIGDKSAAVSAIPNLNDVRKFVLARVDARTDYVVSLGQTQNIITFSKF